MDNEKIYQHVAQVERRNKRWEEQIKDYSPQSSEDEVNAAVALMMLRYPASKMVFSTPTEQITPNIPDENKIANMVPPKKQGKFTINGGASRYPSMKTNTFNSANNFNLCSKQNSLFEFGEQQITITLAENRRRPTRAASPSLLGACRDILKTFLKNEDNNINEK